MGVLSSSGRIINGLSQPILFRGAVSSPAVVDKTNLISWWTLDEASGTRNDSHGTNHLTDNNTVGSAAGVYGNAGNFIYSNDEYLSIASNSSLQSGNVDWWAGCLVKLNTVTARSSLIISKDQPGAREYYLQYSVGSNRFAFGLFNTSNSLIAGLIANTFGAGSINTWYPVQIWHNAATDTMGIRVRDSEDTTSTGGAAVNASSATFRIGEWGHSATPMDGLIDEAWFFKMAPSADQRAYMSNAGAGRRYSDL